MATTSSSDTSQISRWVVYEAIFADGIITASTSPSSMKARNSGTVRATRRGSIPHHDTTSMISGCWRQWRSRPSAVKVLHQ